MKGFVIMFRILLPLFVFLNVSCQGFDAEVETLSRQFSSLTRGTSGPISASESMYALNSAARPPSPQSLSGYIKSAGSSPDPDDYVARMEATQSQMQQDLIDARLFDKGGLANYIIHELKINSAELDRSVGTVLDQINTVEQLINVQLKSLKTDLDHAIGEASPVSSESLLNPDSIKRRYKESLEIIRSALRLSQVVDEEMLNLTFRYFVLNVMGVLDDHCKVNKSDTHENWQKKYSIFHRNASSLHSLFLSNSLDAKKTMDFRHEVEKLINAQLVHHYGDSCDFLAKWYKEKRSAWSQGLQYLGATESNTKKIFESYDTAFRTLFQFACDDPLVARKLNDKKSELLLAFESTDNGFKSGVASYLSWRSGTSTSSATIASPQPTKPANASGWGWW